MNVPHGMPSADSSTETQDVGLAVTTYDNGDAVIVEVGGEVDMLTAPLLRDPVIKALQSHPLMLIVDLSAVRFFGSSGLAMLVEAQQLAGQHTQLRVVADGPTTLRPLQATGLDKQLAVYPTREDALRKP